MKNRKKTHKTKPNTRQTKIKTIQTNEQKRRKKKYFAGPRNQTGKQNKQITIKTKIRKTKSINKLTRQYKQSNFIKCKTHLTIVNKLSACKVLTIVLNN